MTYARLACTVSAAELRSTQIGLTRLRRMTANPVDDVGQSHDCSKHQIYVTGIKQRWFIILCPKPRS